MATFQERQNKAGSITVQARIRIKRQGAVVFEEAESFTGKGARKTAERWASNREEEVKKLLATGKSISKLTIAEGMARYLKEHENVPKPLGKTKKGTMALMSNEPLLSSVLLSDLTSSDIIKYLRKRHEEDGAKPATAMQDLAYIRVLAKYARVVWSIPVDLQEIEDAAGMSTKLGIADRSVKRERRPTLEELDKVMSYQHREKNGKGRMTPLKTPINDIVLFAIFSCRRLSEITRIEWSNVDFDKGTVFIRDIKDPRKKIGNHMTLFLPKRALNLIERQPRVDGEPRVFPYAESTIGTAFQRAYKWAGVEDLTFHDMRHEGVSHLFELHNLIPQVAMVSGHKSWANLQRYTHLKQLEPFDKYEALAQKYELGDPLKLA
jgi:integrase